MTKVDNFLVQEPMNDSVKEMKTYISQFSYKGHELDVMYAKGTISYIFEIKGKRYGNAVKCEGKSVRDIMNATSALLISYIEQREAVEAA